MGSACMRACEDGICLDNFPYANCVVSAFMSLSLSLLPTIFMLQLKLMYTSHRVFGNGRM